MLVTAPTGLSDAVRGLGPVALINACAGRGLTDPEQALRVLASVGLTAARIVDATLAVRAHSIVPELPVSIA